VSFKIYENLAWLNGLSLEDARGVFLDCCGSTAWADDMAEARPFAMVEDLFEAAEKIWFALCPADWLEAYAAHPKIGSKKPAASQGSQAAAWSAGEQSGTRQAADQTMLDLEELNRLYEEKFGFIFIVCATGKVAEEMLAICRARLSNSMETELKLAAIEQYKITEIRLGKLLEK
jgi:OHCU decarboxylase